MVGQDAGGPDPTQIRVGAVVAGRYQVTRIIGFGGMGVVAEARHTGYGQRLALKILHARHRDNAEAVARFTQEGHASARIRGEHSVRLYDAGTHEGSPYLAMELLVGRDLSAVMEDGPLGVAEAASYILQACEGVAEVHAHGMVHRDLKPSNLFLTERPDGSPLIKVLDFGIAKGVRMEGEASLIHTQTFVALGTPLYMSPEQIRASSEVDARADVWSLGTIFYELIAGRPAFGGNTVSNVTAQVLEREPTPVSSLVPGVPPEIDGVVASALQKRADLRYVDVAALAAALEPFAGAAGQGSAARSARILQGALRPDVITTPPVSRDDALGGTIRFDRTRRMRVVRAVLATLAILTGVLCALAISAYRGSRTTSSQALAQRGIRSLMERVAAADAPDSPSANVTVTPAASGAATVRPGPAASSDSSSTSVSTSTSTSTNTSTNARPVRTAPPKASSAAPSSKPFNPFSERN